MLKAIRKHNKWIMVVFGTLLMLTFLIPQTLQQFGQRGEGVTVATIDGRRVSARELTQAGRELTALDQLFPFMTRGTFGIENREVHHWLLLVSEARAAGLVAGPEDGRAFLDTTIEAMMRRDQQLFMALQQMPTEQRDQARKQLADQMVARTKQTFAEGGFRVENEIFQAFANASGVYRLVGAHALAPRFSDRRIVAVARSDRDAVIVDYLTVPAQLGASQGPDPTDDELRAHFDRFKGFKPGEGDFGIGYLLPPRVKLEYMTLDRSSFESAITLDPVEVRKRHQADRARYPGEFAAERAAVERDMRREMVDKAMQDAQLAIQAEVLKITRRLEADGKHKRLPKDWSTQRPMWETIAPIVVDAVKRNQGITIPLPAVTKIGDRWFNRTDLESLPGLGASVLRQGAVEESFPNVVFWARELQPPDQPAPGFVPVQVDVPMADTFFVDARGNRYYVTIRDARLESAPMTIDEIRPALVQDVRTLRAFESIRSRLADLRTKATTAGLEAVATDFGMKPEDIRRGTRVARTPSVFGASPLDEPVLRDPILAAVDGIDPLTQWGQIDPSRATVAVANPKDLTFTFARILAQQPISAEAMRSNDQMNLILAVRSENGAFMTPENFNDFNPFTFANMLKRHNYQSNDLKRLEAPEEFRRVQDGTPPKAPEGSPPPTK